MERHHLHVSSHKRECIHVSNLFICQPTPIYFINNNLSHLLEHSPRNPLTAAVKVLLFHCPDIVHAASLTEWNRLIINTITCTCSSWVWAVDALFNILYVNTDKSLRNIESYITSNEIPPWANNNWFHLTWMLLVFKITSFQMITIQPNHSLVKLREITQLLYSQ